MQNTKLDKVTWLGRNRNSPVPTRLTKRQRARLHAEAEQLGLDHDSEGYGADRRLVVAPPSGIWLLGSSSSSDGDGDGESDYDSDGDSDNAAGADDGLTMTDGVAQE